MSLEKHLFLQTILNQFGHNKDSEISFYIADLITSYDVI